MAELKQNKNAFKVIGKVSGIDKDYAYNSDVMRKGRREGENYKSLNFNVKTSETNQIRVGMFSYEPTQVFLWNSAEAKKLKEKNKKYKGERVPFDEWYENQETFRNDGYAVLETRVGHEYNDENKLISNGLPSYVAIEEIYNNFDNGDSVVIEGEIRYSRYKNRDDKMVEQKNFTIKKIIKLRSDVDFKSEKFDEVSYFEQEMVFVDAETDKKEGKTYVTGRIIDYMKKFHDTQFVVNLLDENGETDSDMGKMSNAFLKKIKFGDVVNVFGDAVNRVIVEESEDEDTEEEDIQALMGGKKKPNHAQRYVSKTYITEASIQGIDSIDKKVYKEQDFVVDELIQKDDKNNEDDNDFGGKKKKVNPFDKKSNSDENDDIDTDDDDLPF